MRFQQKTDVKTTAQTRNPISSAKPLTEDKRLIEANTLSRLAHLFSSSKAPYALNGGAALHFIYLRELRRTPSDIDLRCDDLESCRRMFADRFEPMEKPSPVEMYCFRDENGIIIDITQNRFPRIKKMMKAASVDVLSYDFEVLFAEKLIALARKRDYKDLFDAYSCLSVEMDVKRFVRYLREISEHDEIDPSAIANPSYIIDGGRGGDAPVVPGVSETAMLSRVQSFISSV